MRRQDLTHWHGTPSALAEPADCCTTAFERVAAADLDAAVHAERRRIILEALSVVETYGANVATVLSGSEVELAVKLTSHAADAIRKTGCICPDVEVHSFGQGSQTIPGFDSRCGMHEIEVKGVEVNRWEGVQPHLCTAGCFPEPDQKCVAHGNRVCALCHANPGDCTADLGGCGMWRSTGMHWDTCPNRVRS